MTAPSGLREWLERLGWSRPSARRALVLAGGGVIGGMYEVGALAALDENLPDFRANDFDLYVGSSAGSVVGALLANGVRPLDLYAILDEERDDPLNFQRGAVYQKGSHSGAARNLAQFVWAIGRRAVTDFRLEWPDLLARSGSDMPADFFSLAPLEAYIRGAFLAKGLSNSFTGTPKPLLVAAVSLDRAERVVFGSGDLMDVPISQAIAASSAIPGFFEPYRIHGRDYVDGDVGYTGHADLAVDAGATVLVALNPAVPQRLTGPDAPEIRRGGLYAEAPNAGPLQRRARSTRARDQRTISAEPTPTRLPRVMRRLLIFARSAWIHTVAVYGPSTNAMAVNRKVVRHQCRIDLVPSPWQDDSRPMTIHLKETRPQ